MVTMVALLTALMVPVSAEGTVVSVFSGPQWTDTNGNDIDAHGGGIIQVGNYYYWFGEKRVDGGSLFAAVACYRSSDLKNWEFRNDVLTPQSHPDLNPCNVERPKVVYNESTGQYVMWMHWENGEHYGEAKAAIAYCDTVDGDYTFVKAFRPYEDRGIVDHGAPGYMSRDCTLFVDDDGTGYFISSSNENADMNVYRLTSDYKDVDELVTVLWPGQKREAPALVKKDGVYYMMTSGCTGWSPNQAKYAYSTSLASGWSSLTNVADGSTYSSQPTYIITVEGTQETSYLYLGDRWAGHWGEKPNESGYVMLPLEISNNSMNMPWFNTTKINATTGAVYGEDVHYMVKNVNSGKVLDITGTSNKSNVVTNSEAGDNTQRFDILYDGTGHYKFINIQSGRALDAAGTTNKSNVQLYSYWSGSNQKWDMVDIGNGAFKLICKGSGKAMDAAGTSEGANVQIYGYWGGSNQKWEIVE